MENLTKLLGCACQIPTATPNFQYSDVVMKLEKKILCQILIAQGL